MAQLSEPFFSVVIPTFNRVDFLQQALDSVFAQRFTSYELIVVDDGSTDSTDRFLRSLELRLTHLTQANRGPAAARNLGVGRARGEYLAFLDSDDVWFPWTLELYARVLRETGNPAFLAGRPHRFWQDAPGGLGESHNAHWTRFTDYLASGDQWRWFGVSSFVLARRPFLDSGGFRTERLGIEPGFVQITAPATFGYREHKGNMSRAPRPFPEVASNLIDAEHSGAYPGGVQRRRERRRILARHARPTALACLREGRIAQGWGIYRALFLWNIQSKHWPFVLAFPFLTVLALLGIRKVPV
jgi:hypothetical protein